MEGPFTWCLRILLTCKTVVAKNVHVWETLGLQVGADADTAQFDAVSEFVTTATVAEMAGSAEIAEVPETAEVAKYAEIVAIAESTDVAQSA